MSAAREFRIPSEALFALWEQESGAAVIAAPGDGGASFGPFQIQAVAAERHECDGHWQAGRDHARCAARILADWYAVTGRWSMAFTLYNWPGHSRRKPSWYGMQVYMRMLSLRLATERLLARNP
jgi:hypothetical protein